MEKEFKNSRGRVIGRFKNGTYYKSVLKSKHLMKIFNGYGIDKHIVDELKELECEKILIREKDTGLVYDCPFEVFLDNCVARNFDGMQCFINKKYSTEYNPVQQVLINL